MILNPKSHRTVSINVKVFIYIIHVICVTGKFNFSANTVLNEMIWTYQSIFHIIFYLIIPDKGKFFELNITYTYTHTHTHVYIYIYIYLYNVFFFEIIFL